MFRESTQIIKQHGRNCFVDVRAAFLLGEGKVGFNFRSLNPQTNKVVNKIDCYVSIEEFQFIAHLFKSGAIFSYLLNQQTHRYISYGGKKEANGNIIARQLRIEGDANGLFLKGIQGPGKVTGTGGYTLSCKDNEALAVTIKIDAYQAQMMGFAFQRAVEYYDEWNRQGVLQQKMDAISWKDDAHPSHHAPQGRPAQVVQPQVPAWQSAQPSMVANADFAPAQPASMWPQDQNYAFAQQGFTQEPF